MPVAADKSLSVLFVDDEEFTRKIFARVFADEFDVVTASGVTEALEILAAGEREFAVLVTDFRMPERDGMKLLRVVQREHRHIIRLLATAYAERDVAIAAINQGRVMRILEKPLTDDVTREAVLEAMDLYRTQKTERSTNERRAAALRETLGFLAHELNTPLATVRGSVASVAARYLPPEDGDKAGVARFTEDEPGQLMAALERAERRALYCQSLVSTFVQSARDAYPGAVPQTVSARGLVEALLDEFPFEDDERSWVTSEIVGDFVLDGRRDLLYLVLCTLAKNALIALRGQHGSSHRLKIIVGTGNDVARPRWIRFQDNGPGIPPEILSRLLREPVTSRASSGGNGMGLMFCRRVMESINGSVEVSSDLGSGTVVSLYFRAPPSAPDDSPVPARVLARTSVPGTP
ncbi:hybrid sensor histidine kinase/response regulator [Caenimonas sp. SL110]|uniref:hybrid sensor histidine kinase/response regulator n=1 Tax=Caenimonas sp. SL110 TaxID=1450524 RepID=UPI0009E27895|nr:hybrid sensor histidine kinase/response regulator [Caenimonas sp. SL110]